MFDIYRAHTHKNTQKQIQTQKPARYNLILSEINDDCSFNRLGTRCGPLLRTPDLPTTFSDDIVAWYFNLEAFIFNGVMCKIVHSSPMEFDEEKRSRSKTENIIED